MDQLQEIQKLYEAIPQQIIAQFSTNLQQYEISQKEIHIPTQMDEVELNQLLKNLLQSTLDQQTLNSLHFQFLIQGKLLRGKIKSHIIRFQISCQKNVDIQYFIAYQELQKQDKIQQDDWISIIQGIQHPQGKHLAVGLFSGVSSFYNNKNKQVYKSQLDSDVIKGLKVIPTNCQNLYYVISGGINEQLNVGTLKINKKQFSYNLISKNQYDGSVLGIDTSPLADGHTCIVGNNNSLSIYKVPQNYYDVQIEFNEVKSGKNKKKHLNKKALPFVAKQVIHDDTINCVNWITQNQIVTGSQDHSIRLTDAQRMKQMGKILTKDSITTSIDYKTDRLLTTHQDGYIRLWDIRNPQNPSSTFKAHSKLASCVKFNERSNIFATGSYDNTIKIWDCRSIFPLQNIGTHHDKVFSVFWKNQQELVGGGSDAILSIHTL